MIFLMHEILDTDAISLEQENIDSVTNLSLSKAYIFNNSEKTKQ